jgi:hypothetical protein
MVMAPAMLVGWLHGKSAWRLMIVDERTGELFCVPWIAVEAIVLVEDESGRSGLPGTDEEGADKGTPRSAGGGPQETSERPWWRRIFGG